MGLENPGTVDNISREVQKEVLLSNYMFSGLRCDLQKMFSVSPLFRMQHGFAIGSPVLPPWQMIALYGNSKVREALPVILMYSNFISSSYRVPIRATSR